ncbi:hypothetical protein TNCT_227731, partial [Trichonephila clavata]
VKGRISSHLYSIDAVWTQNLANQKLLLPQICHISIYSITCHVSVVWTTCLVISATAWTLSSVSPALHFSGCLDYRSGHISHCLDTIKCISSVALQSLFGPHCLVISATVWTPPSVSPALHFSGCLDYKSGHISHCLDTIKCISGTAVQCLFGLQVWSYKPLRGHHQVYFQPLQFSGCFGQQVCSYQPLPELH